jgi:hypothetical protein
VSFGFVPKNTLPMSGLKAVLFVVGVLTPITSNGRNHVRWERRPEINGRLLCAERTICSFMNLPVGKIRFGQ